MVANVAMRLLVFQHIDCEHPGRLRNFLRAGGVEWTAVELDGGEPIPRLEDYDALWVMGGPMDVWDVDEHPWLVPEKQAIFVPICAAMTSSSVLAEVMRGATYLKCKNQAIL